MKTQEIKVNRFEGTDLEKFIIQAQPYTWKSSKSEILVDRWLEWPPDVFALTSLVLGHTGVYRRSVDPPLGKAWPEESWSARAKALAALWRDSVSEDQPPPKKIKDLMLKLVENRTVMIDELYDSNSEHAWEVCRAVFELHAISDETMRGVGIAYSPRSTIIQELVAANRNWPGVQEIQNSNPELNRVIDEKTPSGNLSFFYLRANHLLTLRGSLSRVAKYRGIVLPKSRTSQVGLSLRSLSNHLTFHHSEVDVVWRAFPWFNFDENTINIMVVPWPYEMEARSFLPVYHPRTQQELGSQRYFHYSPGGVVRLDSAAIVNSIKLAEPEVRRIHLLILPEMALNATELRNLKDALQEELTPDAMPMIVSGISEKLADSGDASATGTTDSDSDRRHFEASQSAAGYNRMILSTYYAGKWHDVIQDKHHRWCIDSHQIQQYGLGGTLAANRIWWEAIHIPRRRLSILAANSWLTICPLICEDLARLEPVSDLIRGVGPTLVTAILLDGPQLRTRWPARYASVLADDPGSSVLTITAYGMSRRSVPPESEEVDSRVSAEKAKVVALWKDQKTGWKEVKIGEAPGFEARILTISAEWITEATLDGRSDIGNSALLSFQGIDRTEAYRPSKVSSKASNVQAKPVEESVTRRDDAERSLVKVLDMCELTLYTYYADSLIDSRVDTDVLYDWIYSALRTVEGEPQTRRSSSSEGSITQALADLCRYSIKTRDGIPKALPTPHLLYAIEEVTDFVAEIRNRPEFGGLKEPEAQIGSGDELVFQFRRALVEHAKGAVEAALDLFARPKIEQYKRNFLDISSRFIEKSKEICRSPLKSEVGRSEFDISEIGRIRLSTPLAVLWAIHMRLATRRRFGTLQVREAGLMKEIEELVASRSIDYHSGYRDWLRRIRKDRDGIRPSRIEDTR